MTKTVEIVARTVLDVVDAEGRPQMVPIGGKVVVTRDTFAELTRMNAARKATAEERSNPLDHDTDGQAGGAVVLSPKHKGGGKWFVVDDDDIPVSGDELFDSKDAAQAWIDRRPNGSADLG